MFREDAWSALQEASQGHDTTVRLLLEKGVEVNAQGGCYGSAQQAATMAGHDTIVRLLLKHGADMNAQGGYYGNALQAAVESDHEAILWLLIEKGANVKGGVYGGALWAAVVHGRNAIRSAKKVSPALTELTLMCCCLVPHAHASRPNCCNPARCAPTPQRPLVVSHILHHAPPPLQRLQPLHP